MLVLSRKVNECVIIDSKITVKVIRVEGDVVKLGFDAPPEISIHRQEVYERILRSKQREAALGGGQPVGPVPSGAMPQPALSAGVPPTAPAPATPPPPAPPPEP
jgi:carbon storage regulator